MSDRAALQRVEPRELSDWLLARGRHWVTTSEASKLLGVPESSVSPTLARQLKRGRLFSPTKSLYVTIPPEFRSWGAVPASHFIDAMMRHLGHPYYVCLLSAAEQHGFAHQRSQVFQVMSTARLRARSFGRVRLEFVYSKRTEFRPTDLVNTPTGTMLVSTREATILDLVAFPLRSGALFNVATIVGEMLSELAVDMELLTKTASGYPVSIVRRTGWLIDFMGNRFGLDVDTELLRERILASSLPSPLDPAFGRQGVLDERWNVLVFEVPDEEGS